MYLCRILDPITYGNYPKSMQSLVGDRLPKFTESQSEMVKGSIDFLGLNYYTTFYADNLTSYSSINLSYTTDNRANLTCKTMQTYLLYIYIYIEFKKPKNYICSFYHKISFIYVH